MPETTFRQDDVVTIDGPGGTRGYRVTSVERTGEDGVRLELTPWPPPAGAAVQED